MTREQAYRQADEKRRKDPNNHYFAVLLFDHTWKVERKPKNT